MPSAVPFGRQGQGRITLLRARRHQTPRPICRLRRAICAAFSAVCAACAASRALSCGVPRHTRFRSPGRVRVTGRKGPRRGAAGGRGGGASPSASATRRSTAERPPARARFPDTPARAGGSPAGRNRRPISRLREDGLRTTLRLRLPFRRTRDELPGNERRRQLRYALDWAGAHAADLLRFPLPVRPPHCDPLRERLAWPRNQGGRSGLALAAGHLGRTQRAGAGEGPRQVTPSVRGIQSCALLGLVDGCRAGLGRAIGRECERG